MRAFLIALTFVGASAAAEPLQHICMRGDDERSVEVLTPGSVGAACDLRYVRENGANISVPYHADNDPEFCAERATMLVQSLAQRGFDCSASMRQAIAGLSAGVAAGGEALEPPFSPAVSAESLRSQAAETPAASSDEAPTPEIARLEQPLSAIKPPATAPAAAHGPTALAPAGASMPARGPKVAAAGRIVAPAPSTPLLSDVDRPRNRTSLRPSEEVIRGVLAAQAAAWNEGDLDAFMAGYWKDPELSFVSGTTVVKGWTTTLKRYREKYGDSRNLGRLTFEGLDVTPLTDDVAVVVGRFRLERADAADSGVFTLVMKRFEGMWRIVHDHSVGDPPPKS